MFLEKASLFVDIYKNSLVEMRDPPSELPELAVYVGSPNLKLNARSNCVPCIAPNITPRETSQRWPKVRALNPRDGSCGWFNPTQEESIACFRTNPWRSMELITFSNPQSKGCLKWKG